MKCCKKFYLNMRKALLEEDLQELENSLFEDMDYYLEEIEKTRNKIKEIEKMRNGNTHKGKNRP